MWRWWRWRVVCVFEERIGEKRWAYGAVCFFRGKKSVVCRPHLQASTGEEVDQMSAVCKKKRVCFFSTKTISYTQHTQQFSRSALNSLSLYNLSPPPPIAPPPPHHLRHHTTAITPPPLFLYGPSLTDLSLSLRSLSHRSLSVVAEVMAEVEVVLEVVSAGRGGGGVRGGGGAMVLEQMDVLKRERWKRGWQRFEDMGKDMLGEEVRQR
ncbi:hypothetical protein Hanom_Chr11g01041711 [Helianthus anomalus]